MPSLPALHNDEKNLTVSFVDHRGEKSTVSLTDLPAATTKAELDTIATRLGNLSNAGVYSVAIRDNQVIRVGSANALDEAESSVATKAMIVFEDRSGNIRTVQVPAPDRSRMNQNYTALDHQNADNIALFDAITDVLNAGLTPPSSPDWQLRQTSITYTSRSSKTPPTLPTVGEPTPPTNQ